jgi:hypothetical protein
MKNALFYLLPSLALAHFDVVEPTARTVNEETAENAPCGGAPPMVRISVPLKGLIVGTTIFHKGSKLKYMMSLSENPTSQDEFKVAFSPEITVEKASTVRTPPIDLEAIGLTSGKNATLQIHSEDSHETMFQCIDITIAKTSGALEQVSSGVLAVAAMALYMVL